MSKTDTRAHSELPGSAPGDGLHRLRPALTMRRMMPGFVVRRAYVGAVALLLLSCGPDCARDACDALTRRAENAAVGIAGSVATESDAVVDGCAECSSSNARVELWKISTPVSSSNDARALTRSGAPDFSFDATANYSFPLDPGSYLFCVRPNCAEVHVTSGATTVNVKLREGPPSFFIAEPTEPKPVETFGFEVGFETD